MPHKGERINLHIADNEETGLCMACTRGKGGEMAETASMSKPTEKYMETKWDKKMALHEGDIEFDNLSNNVKFDEESITVTSNDKIEIDGGNNMNIGKTEGSSEKKETQTITVEAEDMITLKVTSTESAIELTEYNEFHTSSKVKVSGSNTAPVPIVTRKAGA
jgi:hypothetical protein